MNKIELIEEITKEFLDQLGHSVDFQVEEMQDEENIVYWIKIKSEEAGQLIGFHGKTLVSFQSIIKLMIFRKLGEWENVLVDINDYRQEQKDRLEYVAMNAAQKVRFSNQAVSLSPMSAFERRLVHIVLADMDDIETCSQGEEGNRYVVISPKTE